MLELKAGAAAVNITPFIGGPMSGYTQMASEETDDSLYCKALVLDDGDTEIALVTNDLIGVHLGLVNRVRTRVTADAGIPGDHVLVCTSHTHFGPEIGGEFGGCGLETEADRPTYSH